MEDWEKEEEAAEEEELAEEKEAAEEEEKEERAELPLRCQIGPVGDTTLQRSLLRWWCRRRGGTRVPQFLVGEREAQAEEEEEVEEEGVRDEEEEEEGEVALERGEIALIQRTTER